MPRFRARASTRSPASGVKRESCTPALASSGPASGSNIPMRRMGFATPDRRRVNASSPFTTANPWTAGSASRRGPTTSRPSP
jgi:hypothetical protein